MPKRGTIFLLVAAVCGAHEDGHSLFQKAQTDLNAGRYASAIRFATDAAESFRQSRDNTGLIHALTSRGLAQMYSGDYVPALRTFEEVRDFSERTRDLEYEITSLNNIGTVQYFTGRYSQAMEAYRKAADLVESTESAPWLASRRQLTMANTAVLYQTLGQYDRALDIYNGLLRSAQALPPREEAQLLANIGVLRRRLGDPQKALDTYRTAQALYEKAGHRDGEIAILNNIGILQAMDLKDYRAAAATFTTALERARQAGDRPLTIHARLYRGETLFRDHRLPESAADFQAAATDAATLREQEEEWKAEFGLARIALEEGNKADGISRLQDAVKRIESLRGSLAGSSLRSAFLADKRDVYDLLIENSDYPAEAFRYMEQSRARGLTDRIAPATTAVMPDDTALLEYWMGQNSAAVLWTCRGASGMRRFVLTREERRMLEGIPEFLGNSKNTRWREALGPLAHKLLSDIPPLLDSRTQRLVIVPDRTLSSVPFEVFPFSDKLLIERFTVSYSPAAGLVATPESKRRTRWFWQTSVEAFADPAPSNSGDADPVGSGGLRRLPEARREVEGIAAGLGGRAALYIGTSAVKARLLQSTDAPVLHFATHAVADLENPDLSYILLAPAAPSQRYDYLFLREAGDLPLKNIELVTLSACKTGIGKDVPGEGVQSFARSFLEAGVPSVITSLWAVPDRATSQLMIRFYERLGNGETLGDALRGAKLALLGSGVLAHPSNWAAFVLNGDGRAQLPRVVGVFWFAIPAAIIFAAVALRRRAGKAARSPASRYHADRGSALPKSR